MSFFSEKLFELRKEKGFSQEELAEKLNVARQTISKWENDTTVPDTNNLIELSKIFEISIDDFVGNVKEKDEIEEDKTIKKKKKIIKIILIILLIGILLWYIGIIIYRCAVIYSIYFDIEKANSLDRDYSYDYIEVGFLNGINNKWDFVNSKKDDNKLMKEYYKTDFSLDKDEYSAELIRYEYYEGEDYYDIDLINKTYTKDKNAKGKSIFYNLTTIELHGEVAEFLNNQETSYIIPFFNIPIYKCVFDFSNSIGIKKQENGNMLYSLYFDKVIDGISNFNVMKDKDGNLISMSLIKTNGHTTIVGYESYTYSWIIEDYKEGEVKLPDLTGFTLIEE